MKRAVLATLLVALVATLAFGAWRQASFDPAADGLETALLDLRFRLRALAPAPREIVIVAIDEQAVARIGTMAPLRAALAEAVDRIEAADPLAIAVNLLLVDRTAADSRLAQVLASSDGALLAVATADEIDPRTDALLPEVQQSLARSAFPVVAAAGAQPPARAPLHLFLPHSRLAGAAALGHVNISRAEDRVARQVPLSLPIGDGKTYLPALSLAAARAGRTAERLVLQPGEAVLLGDRRIATDRDGQVTLNHYGPAGSFRTVGLTDLLDEKVAPEIFAGRIVFIGATAESLRDLYATPFAPDVPGVEILATLTGNLLEGSLLRRDRAAAIWTIGLSLLFTALAWRAAWLRRPAMALGTTLLVWLGAAIVVQIQFAAGLLWLDATTILGALLFASAAAGLLRYLGDIQATHRLTREHANLAYYLSPVLVPQLARRPAGEVGGRTQDAAVLFLDVEGYTALAERMPPAQVSDFLGRFHAHAEAVVARHGGAIVEFLGDGVLAVFGLPDPGPGDAAEALACGAALLDEDAPAYPVLADGRPVQLRVSVHYGPVGTAVLGGRGHGHFTVTGDTVNVAARLQEVAKQHGEIFVATRRAVDMARTVDDRGLPRFVPLTDVAIRGRQQITEVWAQRDDGPRPDA
ncbi:MAG: adenylate/guanylate cyclase domain-containing protein [Sneathiellaceae bacterium]